MSLTGRQTNPVIISKCTSNLSQRWPRASAIRIKNGYVCNDLIVNHSQDRGSIVGRLAQQCAMQNWKNSVKPKSQDKAILSRAAQAEGAETTGVPARASNNQQWLKI